MKVKTSLLGLCLSVGLSVAVAEDSSAEHALQATNAAPIPVAVNLQADAELSQRTGVPIMLVVSQNFCSYCEQLKAEVIRPMIFSGEYVDKVMIRELRVDEDDVVIDFDGKHMDPGEIASRYQAWVTPTLLFLGPGGVQQAEKIKGFNTPEMYAQYVDESIEDAHLKIMKLGKNIRDLLLLPVATK